jgi:creatinine amidohydrolase/Fe(II)-dependent formamide hydrolase-like protein
MKKILVQHVGDYYFKNEQFEWLEKKGFSKWDIGFHAGIRDTSEMLTVFPAGVKLQYKVSEIDNLYNGSHGDASKASPEIGSQMLKLKIDAAVKQIERVRTMHVINNHGFGLRK